MHGACEYGGCVHMSMYHNVTLITDEDASYRLLIHVRVGLSESIA